MVGKIARDLAHGDLCRLIKREAVDARADGREIDRMTVVFARKAQAVAVAIGQQLRLTVLPVAPARTRRVDDVARRQAIAAGDLRLAGTAAVKTAALIEQTVPAAMWMAPSTPPPPSSEQLAALTMASTSDFVMLP